VHRKKLKCYQAKDVERKLNLRGRSVPEDVWSNNLLQVHKIVTFKLTPEPYISPACSAYPGICQHQRAGLTVGTASKHKAKGISSCQKGGNNMKTAFED
jgi:hypothetical protein